MFKVTLMALCLFSTMLTFADGQICGRINYLKVNSHEELEIRLQDIETTFFAENRFGSSILSIISTAMDKDFTVCLEVGKQSRINRQFFKAISLGEKIPSTNPVEENDNKPDMASTSIITN